MSDPSHWFYVSLRKKKTMEILLYQTADGRTSIDVKLENETVWLSKEQMAILFERDRTIISRHIRSIFQEGELDEKVVCAKIAHTNPHGALPGKTQTNIIEIYNLDVIISEALEYSRNTMISRPL